MLKFRVDQRIIVFPLVFAGYFERYVWLKTIVQSTLGNQGVTTLFISNREQSLNAAFRHALYYAYY